MKLYIKVLVVVDVKLNQLMMSGILDDFKFEHDIADNGKIAVALWISAPGQGDFELVPFAADAFTLKAVPGYNIQFDMKDNKPVGLSFTQPNGVFKASVKK